MSSFVPDLFDGLPEVSEADLEGDAVRGLRSAVQRLNDELAFVRELAGAKTIIDAI